MVKDMLNDKFNKSMRFFASLRMTNKTISSYDIYHSIFTCHPEDVSPKDLFFKICRTYQFLILGSWS
jgi:hypothetical protein